MPEEITITPERAAALWEQFEQDTETSLPQMEEADFLTQRQNRLEAQVKALALAVSRAVAAERERCAVLAERHNAVGEVIARRIRRGD